VGRSHSLTSDGHSNGAHEAMVLRRVQEWTVKCGVFSLLGMIRIGEWLPHAPRPLTVFLGPFVRSLGIVTFVLHVCVAHLNPMLPIAVPTDYEQSQWDAFLAFEAAPIVISKLRAGTRQLLQEKTLPEIPLKSRELPSITGIEALPTPITTYQVHVCGLV